jgi:hypothetical protein
MEFFHPATDGAEWPLPPTELLQQGKWQRVPIMLGYGREEPITFYTYQGQYKYKRSN